MSIDPKLLKVRKPTPAQYQRQRIMRGTQVEVAEQLGIKRPSLARRETAGPVTREAWLALCALPTTQ